MENVVFLKLLREQTPGEEIYYYKNQQGYEVDFVIKQGNKISHLIQVCSKLKDARKREIRTLLHASGELKCNELLVINEDYEGREEVSWFGMKGSVEFIPLWK